MTKETDRLERDRLLQHLEEISASFETMALPSVVGPLRSIELTIQQMKVLMVIATTEDGTNGRVLSESFDVSLASMSGLLDRLAAQGMLVRSLDPEDGRVRKVHVTPKGRAMLRSLMAARPEFSPDILALLDLEDLKALEQGLRAIMAKMLWLSGQG
ncbi:MarR family transcriptional regulator [Arthrobacter sp. efr-133-TYG-118]|uniref:MarR family winged helix-turn-helix transcriptional regulator n=1 Tax=Arthrobacter sp. efr-133-TYG-118 TaxID=3040279 RepID=UPI00254AC553|nr:MarR family transcriptional regulator [Arthrobacter sp. efr-133-TYG-118]